MPEQKRIDPFKPMQPSIPGVASAPKAAEPTAPELPLEPSSGPPPTAAAPMIGVAVVVVAVVVIVGGLFYWSRSLSSRPQPTSPGAAATPVPTAAETPKPKESLPVGPGRIGTTDELTKAWSAKRFLYNNPLTSQIDPAMVVRLPGGAYWGFSLREPFGTCELEYITDLEKLRTVYNYRADHPMVGNTCDHTVYDLLRYGGGAPDGGLVRGEIVQGGGVRPPMAIEIRTDGKYLVADRAE